MDWSEIVLLLVGDGVVLAIFGAIYKSISDKSLDKKIQQGLDNLDLLTESQLTKVLQENIKINDQRKFIRQEMTSNNISHMRQAWINDLRTNAASFISLTNDVISTADIYFKINTDLSNLEDHEKFCNIIRMGQDSLIEMNNNISKIRSLYSYLDLLLPFSCPELNKLEPEADEIRRLIKEIKSKVNYVLADDYKELSTLSVNLTGLLDSLVGELKMLLYKEWKVASTLKELEDIDKRKDE